VSSHDACEGAFIGDSERGISKLMSPLKELPWMRRAVLETEVLRVDGGTRQVRGVRCQPTGPQREATFKSFGNSGNLFSDRRKKTEERRKALLKPKVAALG
jgi:hypothetical protein